MFRNMSNAYRVNIRKASARLTTGLLKSHLFERFISVKINKSQKIIKMKKNIVLALFIGVLLISGIASAQVGTTTTTSTATSTVATTTPACPTFVAVDVAALRVKCAAEGGTIYQPEATSGCLPPPICQKTDKFVCPMIAMPDMAKFEQSCTAQGGRVVSRVSNNGCQMPPVCEKQIVRKPELNINPEGKFTGRALIVKSVASTTLVAEVWGTSWTIDFSNVKNVIYKDGSERKVETVATQVLPGQEISVLGRVSKDKPGVVMAEVLRNYNQTEVINPIKGTELWEKYSEKFEKQLEQQKKQFEIKYEQGKKNAELERERSSEKIQEMLKQLQELQNKLKNSR